MQSTKTPPVSADDRTVASSTDDRLTGTGHLYALQVDEDGEYTTSTTARSKQVRRYLIFGTIFAVMIGTAIAVIVVSLRKTAGTLDSDNTPAFLSDVPQQPSGLYAVTDLRVVQGTDRTNALTECATDASWVATGAEWKDANERGVKLLCLQHSPIDRAGATNALQRLVVLTNMAQCPSTMTQVYAPRSDVVVCAKYQPFDVAIKQQSYIGSVAVTREREYNNEVSGWQTIPSSIHEVAKVKKASDRVFISVHGPVLPIVNIKAVSGVWNASDVLSACNNERESGWEQAGTGFIDASASNKTVLCVRRAANNSTSQVLTDLQLNPNASVTCGVGFTSQGKLGATASLCAKWSTGANSDAVGDIVLYRAASADIADVKPKDLLPGKFSALSTTSLNGDSSDSVFLLTRKTKASSTQTQGSSSGSVPAPPPARKPLQAAINNGSLSFRVLQIADLHLTGNPNYGCSGGSIPSGMSSSQCREAVALKFIEDLLDAEQPDMVVFTGDNINPSQKSLREKSMEYATEAVEKRGVPYAMILGNHDDEDGYTREDIIALAMSKENSYTQRGPRSVAGVGNYELSVRAPVSGPWGDAGSDVFRMYFLDSHASRDKTKFPTASSAYAWIEQSQIDYYRELSDAHNKTNQTPAIMFFHIPIPEYANTPTDRTNGEFLEAVSSPDVNSNLFSALVEMNEVKATFAGHDHYNEYCYAQQGIQLCYGGGAGFGRAYGRSTFARRARVIEWSVDSNNRRQITSWKRHHGSVGKKRSQEVLYREE